MDTGAISAASAIPMPLRSVEPRVTTPASTTDFGSMLGREVAAAGTRPAGPDALVGQQLAPPPGGCSCDAMAATTAPAAAASPVRSPGATSMPDLGTAVSISPAAVQPGDVLGLDSGVAGERLHLAIVRNAFEMLRPDANGVVGIATIPWDRVRDIRRPI